MQTNHSYISCRKASPAADVSRAGYSSSSSHRYIPRRAVLYVPGNDEKKIKKIPSLNVDCAVLDCEDGVAANKKVMTWFCLRMGKGEGVKLGALFIALLTIWEDSTILLLITNIFLTQSSYRFGMCVSLYSREKKNSTKIYLKPWPSVYVTVCRDKEIDTESILAIFAGLGKWFNPRIVMWIFRPIRCN